MKSDILSLGKLMEEGKDEFLNLRDSCNNLTAKVPMTKNLMLIIKMKKNKLQNTLRLVLEILLGLVA